MTITIDGANDAAAISGAVSGSVTEAGGVNNGTPGTPTATGDLNATDSDNPADAWNVVATPLPTDNHFGTYTLTATGVWTYTLNNSNAAVQALNVGQTLTDTFTVATIGGTAQLITVTINGANDAAVVTGLVTGTVLEAGGVNNGSLGTPTATGDLNAADVDNPNDAWTAVATPAASASGYGTYTLTAAGVWTYTLDNSNAAVQGLRVGQALTDTFTVTTIDGTARLVTITINGSDDSPTAVADNNASDPVTESGVNPGNTPFAGDPSAAGNVLANDLDVDSGDTKTGGCRQRRSAQRRPVAGRRLRRADGFGRRQLELRAQQRRPRHQCAGAGPGRHRGLHLHHGRRRRRDVIFFAHRRHHRNQ